MNTQISIEDLYLRFRIFRNPNPNIKEAFIDLVTRRRKNMDKVIEFYALKNINLQIKGGERVGIIGLNGAGKSSLLRTIVGIYPPQRGRISITGSITPLIDMGAGFDYEQSGRDNIFLNGAILGIPRQEMKKREKDIIDFSELGDFIDMPVKYYSTGMFMRLAFSIATMVEPEILIVDEIFAGGDAHFVSKSTEHMVKLLTTSKVVLLVSHSEEIIRRVCNEVIILHKGEVFARGDPDEMYKVYHKEILQG